MSIAAISSAVTSPAPALAPSKANEEASENAATRAQEAGASTPTQAAKVPGTGTLVDVTA